MKINMLDKSIKLFIFFVCFLFAPICRAEIDINNSKDISMIKSKGYIIMGTSADFSPFEFLKSGKVTGIDVEIARKIADKLGVELEIKDTSFNSLIMELNNEEIDFIVAGFTKTEERAKSVDFSDSYFTASQKIVVKNNSSIKNPEDIHGKKVGVQLGTTGDSLCSGDDFKDIQVFRYEKFTEAIIALSSGSIDCVVMDGFSANQVVKNNINFCVIPESLTEESYCIGIKKGNLGLMACINKIISEMKQSGEIDKIVDSYMNHPEVVSSTNDSKFLKSEHWQYIVQGLYVTLKVTLFSMMIGILLGVLAASLRIISDLSNKLKILGILVNFYTTVIRGTPVIVQLFIIYYVALSGISKNPIIAAVVTLGINSGAYVCEHIRAGIQAISKGQIEAGKSLGLSEKTLMSKIIIPQAVKNTLPSLAGEAISLLKETAAVGFIGVMDLSLAGKKITSVTFDPVLPLFTVAAIYLVLVVVLTFILNKIERKMKNANN